MASNEDVSIFDEIEEELKQDKMYASLKKHKNTIMYALSIAVLAIITYSSWYSRKQQRLEAITTALVDVLRRPASEKSSALIESLLEDAPSEMRPLLVILKAGRGLLSSKEVQENANELLTLANKGGVDRVWKDLAMIIYASYNLVSTEQLQKILEPLTAEDRPFKFMAMELLAFSYLNEKQKERAIKYLQKILDHKASPDTLKMRIAMILNHIRNTGE